MKTFNYKIIALILCMTVSIWAEEPDSLFPEKDAVSHEKIPSLKSAISQFEDIIKDSAKGQMETLQSNETYNQSRSAQLQQKLKQKQDYLKSIPSIISSRFDSLMLQYPHANQKAKNKMAQELHGRWKSRESQVKQEIAQLQEQLANTTQRQSESAVQKQILQINAELANSEQALYSGASTKPVNPSSKSPVFINMMKMSKSRVLSKLSEFCNINIKPIYPELSLSYLDN